MSSQPPAPLSDEVPAAALRLVPVMDNDVCVGSLINLGWFGIEAFDRDEKSLGVFPDMLGAATAVRSVASASLRIEPAQPAHSPFGGSVAWRVLHCPASVHWVEKVPAHLRRPSATRHAAARSTW